MTTFAKQLRLVVILPAASIYHWPAVIITAGSTSATSASKLASVAVQLSLSTVDRSVVPDRKSRCLLASFSVDWVDGTLDAPFLRVAGS